MDTNQIPSHEPIALATSKKPYEKPSFRFEQVFVTTALKCGKVGTAGQCSSPQSS